MGECGAIDAFGVVSSMIVRGYLNALSLGFFEAHIAQQPSDHSYLSGAYANSMSQAPWPLSLLQSCQGLDAISGQPSAISITVTVTESSIER